MNNMLDNAASCRPYPWAVELFAEKSMELFANQESAGALGVKSAKAMEDAAEQLASSLAPGYGVLFCNTATDALRAAVTTALRGKRSPISLTTKAEHPALLKALEEKSEVHFCKLNKNGSFQMPEEGDPALFAVHHVNAETGIIQDPAELKKQLSPETIFLLDTTQSVCRIPVPGNIPDFLTVSGCKIGAPCGAALLYRKEFQNRIKILRSEEHGIGRCSPAAAIVLSETVRRGIKDLEQRRFKAESLRKLLKESLADLEIQYTADGVESSPWINHFLLPGYQGGILVRMLLENGITVSAGSACSSETPEPSAVLRGLGYPANEAYSALRVSFSDDTEAEEVLFFANTLHTLLKNY